MSLMKSYNNTNSSGLKKCFNLTAQVADTLITINNKNGVWKSKTSKMIKTLTNKDSNPNSNIMTQDDIDKLFGKCKTGIDNGSIDGKIDNNLANDNWKIHQYCNYVNKVEFLKMEDQSDKFMTGIPEHYFQEDPIDRLFNKNQEKVDLTTEFKKNYLVGKIIGQGAYASVRVAIYKPEDKKIAIKIYQKNKIKQPQRKKSVRRQIIILSLLNHKNIVKILDVVQTNNHLNIIMQYLPGTSLGSYLKAQPNGRISQKQCKKIFENLAKALKYMHAMNIAHRDIKLQNIILDEELNPKIIDFGFSTCIEVNKKNKIFCGTPSYMAPEVVQKKQYRGESADIWALGVMLFVCLTGIFPFKGATDQQLYRKINHSDYPKGQLIFSRTISDLIARMLKIEPQQRITAHEILKHAWFNENNPSRKKHTETSLQNNRKRINTQTSNILKQNKYMNKTGVVKKVLCQTTGNQNLKLQIKMALQSPKMKQQIQSYRVSDKQNALRFLKNDKIKVHHQKKDKTNLNSHNDMNINKAFTKVIDLGKIQMKKRSSEKSRNKKRLDGQIRKL